MDNWLNPLYEMDVFVRGKFITSNTIYFIKRDIKENIEEVWGYKKETIEVVTYPLNLLKDWELIETNVHFRKYQHPFTGEIKIIKGKKHGTGCIYKWRLSFTFCCFSIRNFFTKFLYK